jgi:hypothetical protein
MPAHLEEQTSYPSSGPDNSQASSSMPDAEEFTMGGRRRRKSHKRKGHLMGGRKTRKSKKGKKSKGKKGGKKSKGKKSRGKKSHRKH